MTRLQSSCSIFMDLKSLFIFVVMDTSKQQFWFMIKCLAGIVQIFTNLSLCRKLVSFTVQKRIIIILTIRQSVNTSEYCIKCYSAGLAVSGNVGTDCKEKVNMVLTRWLWGPHRRLQQSSCSNRSSPPTATAAAQWSTRTSLPQKRWRPFRASLREKDGERERGNYTACTI